VTAPSLFPSLRVSDSCSGSRSTPFSSSTGIRQLLWFPLHPFFLLHGYQTAALVPTPPLFLLHGYQTAALVPTPPLFSSSTGIRQPLWFPLLHFLKCYGFSSLNGKRHFQQKEAGSQMSEPASLFIS
jgi:hypothetical protein